jgi:hypothetical protein
LVDLFLRWWSSSGGATAGFKLESSVQHGAQYPPHTLMVEKSVDGVVSGGGVHAATVMLHGLSDERGWQLAHFCQELPLSKAVLLGFVVEEQADKAVGVRHQCW